MPDGTLGVVGRRDGQVKIRGNRLELSEVEAVIREIGHVEDVALQTIKHGSNNELVAYVVVDGDLDDGGISDLVCDYVRERKPEYMVPSFVIGLDAIPPILSVYHQDKDYSALNYLKNISFKFIAIVGVVFAAILLFMPNVVIMLYSVKVQYVAIVTEALRLYGLSYLTLGFVFFYIFYTQSIQKNKLSNAVSISYNLIIVIAMLIILPRIFGNDGVWITQFCVGLITLAGIFIYSRYINKKSDGEYKGIFINKSPGDNIFEFTINANAEEAKGLVSLIKKELAGNRLADYACLSLEEFLMNIIKTNEKLDKPHGYIYIYHKIN